MSKISTYQNLAHLISLFGDNHYYLAKYLMDNNAFSEEFLNILEKSRIIEEKNPVLFKDINHMQDYFNSIIGDNETKERTRDELIEYLNNKLNHLLSEEKYEEVISLRDYMIKNNIPILK